MSSNQNVDLYRNLLLQGFYEKRGKSISIPHILYALHRFHENFPTRRIRILDIGCGQGDLLNLIMQSTRDGNLGDLIDICGVDIDTKRLKQAQIKLPQGKFHQINLAKSNLLKIGVFDLIVSINTLHEVYSITNKPYMSKLIKNISQALDSDGTLIIYDGLDVPDRQKLVTFRIKTTELEHRINKFISEYGPKLKDWQQSKGAFSVSAADFVKFASTFKYLNSPFWQIVSKEVYGYFNIDEFKQCLNESSLILDSMVISNNDLGLWQHHIELLSEEDFPFKSILISATKHYLPSQHDIFVENS